MPSAVFLKHMASWCWAFSTHVRLHGHQDNGQLPGPQTLAPRTAPKLNPCSDSAIGSVWLVTDLIMSQLEWQHKQKYASPWRSMKPENLQNCCAHLSLWLYQGLCSIWRGCNFIRLTSFVEKKICNGIIKIEVHLSRLIYNGAFLNSNFYAVDEFTCSKRNELFMSQVSKPTMHTLN